MIYIKKFFAYPVSDYQIITQYNIHSLPWKNQRDSKRCKKKFLCLNQVINVFYAAFFITFALYWLFTIILNYIIIFKNKLLTFLKLCDESKYKKNNWELFFSYSLKILYINNNTIIIIIIIRILVIWFAVCMIPIVYHE